MRRWRAFFLEQLSALRKWVWVLLGSLALLFLCLFLFSPVFHIREIRVVRTEGRVELPKVLQTLAPLYGRHLLFLATHDVTTKVREVVPDAVSVTVSKKYPSQVSIRIELVPLVAQVRFEPSAENTLSGSLLASGSGADVAPQRREFLTENGLLVSALRPAAADPLPIARIVDWSVRPVPGAVLLPPEFFQHMRRMEQVLVLEFGQNIRLRTVYLRAREFHLDTDKISFWFDVRAPVEVELERLRMFLKSVKLTEVKSYVDLRLTGRVVYK